MSSSRVFLLDPPQGDTCVSNLLRAHPISKEFIEVENRIRGLTTILLVVNLNHVCDTPLRLSFVFALLNTDDKVIAVTGFLRVLPEGRRQFWSSLKVLSRSLARRAYASTPLRRCLFCCDKQ
jgi:hypothetical protein